jgi:hypothetical protein
MDDVYLGDWQVSYRPPGEPFPYHFQAYGCTSHSAMERFLKSIPAQKRGSADVWQVMPTYDYS